MTTIDLPFSTAKNPRYGDRPVAEPFTPAPGRVPVRTGVATPDGTPALTDAATDATGRVPERDLLGIPFATLDFAAVVRTLAERAMAERFVYLATPNANHLVSYRRGVEGFAFGLSRAWFLTCDSQVLRHLGRVLFKKTLPLVTGSDLTQHLLRHVIQPDDPITVIGGDDRLRRDLEQQYGLRRIALHSPPFGFSRDEAQLQRCIDFVRDNPARFVFLACGAPQSEVLAARIVEAGGASGIGLCIGASLLFATGQLKRAPRVWQKLSLEWLYRLKQERRRMARRFWHAQLPVLSIAAAAWLSPRPDVAHGSRLQRPQHRLPTSMQPGVAGRGGSSGFMAADEGAGHE